MITIRNMYLWLITAGCLAQVSGIAQSYLPEKNNAKMNRETCRWNTGVCFQPERGAATRWQSF